MIAAVAMARESLIRAGLQSRKIRGSGGGAARDVSITACSASLELFQLYLFILDLSVFYSCTTIT